MSSPCCNLLNQYTMSAVEAWRGGRDLTEAVKQIAGFNSLDRGQIDQLCSSVNSAMRSIGETESVSPQRVAEETSSSSLGGGAVESSSKYCDTTGPLPGDGMEIMNTLSKAAGDICFYGCFAAALYQSASSRYAGVKDALTDAGTAFTSLMQQLAQSGNRWGTSFQDQLTALEGLVKDVIASPESIAQAFKGQSFSEIMWGFLKSYGARYANYIIAGAAQSLVNELKAELDSRADKYLIMDQKLTALKAAMEALVGYDWWDEFVASVTRAKSEISRADASLVKAQVGVETGTWDMQDINYAQARIMLAKSSVSSVDMIGNTAEELGTAILSGDPWAFRWNVGRSIRQDFIDDMETLSKLLEEMRQLMTCLELQGRRIEILKSLITALYNSSIDMSDISFVNVAIDVQVDTDIVDTVRRELRRIHSEMTSVIANEDRVSAPVFLSGWHVSLMALLNGLKVLNVYPSTQGLDPLGLSGYVGDSQAMNALGSVVLSLEDHSAPSGMQFLVSIINNAGNLSLLMANRSSWRNQIGQIKTQLRANSSNDKMASAVCSEFSGNDNEYYDYLIGSLKDMGWKGAQHTLERGQVAQFLRMGLYAGAAMSAGADCISSLLEGFSDDMGINAALGEEFNRLQAESIVSIKAPAMLPAFQFDAIISIAGKLRDIQEQLTRIAAIKEGVC